MTIFNVFSMYIKSVHVTGFFNFWFTLYIFTFPVSHGGTWPVRAEHTLSRLYTDNGTKK